MHPLTCSSIDRRRRRILLIHSSLSGIIRQLSASEIYVFWICWSSVPTTWGGCASCLETERKSTGMKKKALGSTLASSGEEERWSVRRAKCVRCVCVMTLCQVAQGNQNKMAKLPRTSLNPKLRHFQHANERNWQKNLKKVMFPRGNVGGEMVLKLDPASVQKISSQKALKKK